MTYDVLIMRTRIDHTCITVHGEKSEHHARRAALRHAQQTEKDQEWGEVQSKMKTTFCYKKEE